VGFCAETGLHLSEKKRFFVGGNDLSSYSTPDIKDKMEMEDDFLEELRTNERRVAEKDKAIDEISSNTVSTSC
jgi:hypothetical protein